MAAPRNDPARDLEVAEQAARRWRARTTEREQKRRAVRQGDYTAAEPRARLVKRVNRLRDHARALAGHGAAPLPPALGELAEHETYAEKDLSDALLERVLGQTRDFVGIDFVEKALYVSRSVGRVATPLSGNRKTFGTGFLVAPRLLLTNHHVLSSPAHAQISVAEFDVQLDRTGQPQTVERFALDPGTFFLADRGLDFALVAVAEVSERGTELATYGYLPLIRQEGKISVGEPVNIVQHPAGEMKQLVLRQNRLLDLPGDFAHYEADTEPGSSGAPVFNDQWEVVALHHSGVPKVDETGNLLTAAGAVWRPGDDPARLAWVANEGVRVSRLVAFVEQAAPAENVALRDELLRLGQLRPAQGPVAAPPFEAKTVSRQDAVSGPSAQVEVTLPLRLTLRVEVVPSSSPAGTAQSAQASVAPGAEPDALAT